MKNLFTCFLTLAFIAILFVHKGNAQVTVSGSNYANRNFTTLGAAFAAINANAQTGKLIDVTIGSNTSEPTPAILNGGSWGSIRIFPTVPGVSITGNLGAPLIDLNGADNVLIYGSGPELAGSTLTITNNSTSWNAGTSTIRLINGASNNSIKNCVIKGSSTDASAGVVFFSTTIGTGNNNNTIDNNKITNAGGRPVNGIYSYGTNGNENLYNILRNNHIYDCLSRDGEPAGIFISNNSSMWTITGNNFFETITSTGESMYHYTGIRVYPESDMDHPSNPGRNFSISNNYIGGSAPNCSGKMVVASTGTSSISTFTGIYLETDITGASSVNNNTIGNIAASIVGNDYSGNELFYGINIASEDCPVTIDGNTIGATTGTGSITLTATNYSAISYGIIAGPGNCVIQNNRIGSITTVGSDSYTHSFYGIYKHLYGGTSTISNNTIGSTTTANSINASSASASALESQQNVYGIYCSNSVNGTLNISENIIANMNNAYAQPDAMGGQIVGIFAEPDGGISNILNNTIHHLSTANPFAGMNNDASVIGIVQQSSDVVTVSGNTIYSLSNTYESFEGRVTGLYFRGTGVTDIVSKNFIHSLSVNPSSTMASLYGIYVDDGTTTYSNNIISLGGNTSTDIYGIYENGGSGNKFYFNTVNIDGSFGPGGINKSYALYTNVNTQDCRNNIFSNARSTINGAGPHYAMFHGTAEGTFTANYNNYFSSGTSGMLAYYNSDLSGMSELRAATGQDVFSLNTDPGFTSAGGTTASDYLPSATSMVAATGTGVTTDYTGAIRSVTYPAMGAFEYSVRPLVEWTGATSQNWNTPENWYPNVVPTSSHDVLIVDITNDPVVNEAAGTPAVCTNLTVESGAMLTIDPGKALSVSGLLTNNSTEGIIIESDGTGTGSLIAGSVTGTGSAIAQVYMETGAWHQVSPPLAGEPVANFLLGNDNVATKDDTNRAMMNYNTSDNTWSLFYTNLSGGTFAAGQGYMMRTDFNSAVSFTGTLKTGTSTVTLSGAGDTGWNLIGNPYSSSIDINSHDGTDFMAANPSGTVLDASSLGIYVWNQVADKYDVINWGTTAENASLGQAFFVKSAVNGANVTFNPAMQVHSTVALKSAKTAYPEIKLLALNDGKNASTSIKFIGGTTKGLDPGYDAGIFSVGASVSLYTKLIEDNGVNFMLQCLPENDYSSMIIPVGINSKAGGEVLFSAETINLSSDCSVILEDKLHKKFTDLSKNDYSTTVEANSSISDRFRLHTSYQTTGLNVAQGAEGKLSAYTVRNVEIRVEGEVSKQALATLYDIQGRVVLVKNLEEGSMNIIPTPNIRPGIYMLSVKDNNQVQGFKIPVRE